MEQKQKGKRKREERERERERENESGGWSERGGNQTGSAWKRKQRRSLIHRGLYQNLITSEAKATAKEERGETRSS